ncbi:MAG: hypothetical protein NC337_08735 [Roseburia sp.]|nr:hypothetical protein [Roseburia sp.]
MGFSSRNFLPQGGCNALNEEEKSSLGNDDSENAVTSNIVKRTIKDSVFTDLFRDKKYLFQLYRALHPEDLSATEEALTDITIKNVLTDGQYNDLGFLLGNRLMILVEAQSTWTVNIIFRAFFYLAQTYHDYFERTAQNLYACKRVTLPTPELYVIYTGERGNKPDTLSLSKDFLSGEAYAIDIRIKVLYESDKDDIINQYIIFSKVYDKQRKLYGRSKEAILQTIRICKDRNILRNYLENRESEVISIMMSLYDEEEIMRTYIKCERNEAALNKARNTAVRLIKLSKMTLEDIADATELPLDTVKELEAEVLQLKALHPLADAE